MTSSVFGCVLLHLICTQFRVRFVQNAVMFRIFPFARFFSELAQVLIFKGNFRRARARQLIGGQT
jgi:hypothetical protein